MTSTALKDAPGLAVALPESALNMVPLGIAKVDRAQRLTYANKRMLQMAGLPGWEGYTLADVFAEEDLARVREGLRSRFEERVASEYRVDLKREDNGKLVPVSITAFPETNEANEVVGTLALVRDLTIEMAQKEMYRLVEKESNSERLLDAIVASLRPLVPFDRVSVVRLNEERTHLRTIYDQFIGREAPPATFRWWRIHPSVKDILNSRKSLVINDLPHWYREPSRQPMLDDPIVKDFLKLGFVSTMSLPVSQNDMQVASIVLYRYEKSGPFNDAELEIADELPLAEAVSVALRSDTESNLNFLIELIMQTSSAHRSVKTVAQAIVDRISEHYGWPYVSIYQVYEHRRQFRLIAERALKDGLQLPKEQDSTFSIDEGVIGHVYRTRKGVTIADITKSDAFRRTYVAREGIDTRSELCVPVGKDARWLLNVEDNQTDAFAPQERRDLESIAAGLGSLLQRTLDYQYRTAVVERANDAIILTDIDGAIREINPATCDLLDMTKERVVGRPIQDFFADAEQARVLLEGGDFPNHEALMQRGADAAGDAEQQVKVLLSVATLPEEAGGKIFVASDMTQLQRIRQLELAQDLYREVTGQIKTPMALAIAWLRRSAHGRPTEGHTGADELTHKVIQQLQKAELTLDRLMLVERRDGDEIRHEVLLSVNDMLDSIVRDMPIREREVVIVTRLPHDDAYVRADAYELRYCLQTVLSYLLRLTAEDDLIEMNANRSNGRITFSVCGHATALEAVDDIDTECRTGQVRAELSLGKSTLTRLAERNHGEFAEIASGLSGHVTFVFSFPDARKGAWS